MNCVELLAKHSRCRRGIPVARLFRHYFCEGNPKVCPLKRMEKVEKRRALNSPKNLLISKGGV